MIYKIEVNPRALKAILTGWKKVEIRTNTPDDPIDYFSIVSGDILEFFYGDQKASVSAIRVSHYPDAYSLFMSEGLKNVASSRPDNIDIAVERINQITDYEPAITKHGVCAIEFDLM